MLPANRWLLPVAIAVVVVMLTGVGAAYWLNNARKQPALAALRSSQDLVRPLLADLRRANTMNDVRDVGGRAPQALTGLESQLRVVTGSSDELDARIATVLKDDHALVEATQSLGALDATHLDRWAETRAALSTASTALARDASILARSDGDAGRTVVLPTGIASRVSGVVGDFAATTVGVSLRGLLERVGNAATSADLQRVAADAARTAAVVDTAGRSLDASSPQKPIVDAVGGALGVLQRLGAIDADNLTTWPGVRSDLGSALGKVPADQAAGDHAVANVNDLVARGTQRLRDWRVAYAAAVQSKKRDAMALSSYTGDVRSALKDYAAMRTDASDFVTRVENGSVTWTEAFTFLDSAKSDRQGIRDQLNYVHVPDGLSGAHQRLVDVVQHAIEAVQSGYDGMNAAYSCADFSSCYYADTSGWEAFHSASKAITQEFAAAESGWESAVASARAAVDARSLPAKPVI